MPRSTATRNRNPKVVDFEQARRLQRQKQYRARLSRVLEGNRRALSRLFHSGLIFTRQGARAGRDLLLAHQHLLKVGELIGRLEKSPPSARRSETPIYDELEMLLAKSDQLASRTDEFVASLR